MWKEWYTPYFLDQKYNQTPRLMVRHEDMVYRPEKVIQKICNCVGGTNKRTATATATANNKYKYNRKIATANAPTVTVWEDNDFDRFVYQEESANMGKGHGTHQSGLFAAVVKYGQPLRNWYDQYSESDRKRMKSVFQDGDFGNGKKKIVVVIVIVIVVVVVVVIFIVIVFIIVIVIVVVVSGACRRR